MFLQRGIRKANTAELDTLAQAYRCAITTVDSNERFFALNVHNRDFRIAERYWKTGDARGIGLTGDDGLYLMVSTSLKHFLWKSHVVDLRKIESRPPADGALKPTVSGDQRLNSAFALRESNNTLPEKWATKTVQADSAALFKIGGERASLFAGSGVLMYAIPIQDKAIDARASQEMLRCLGLLASSLDITSSDESKNTASDESGDDPMAEPQGSTQYCSFKPPVGAGSTALAHAAECGQARAYPVSEQYWGSTNDASSHGRAKYTLRRSNFTVSRNYRFADEAGVTRYTVASKLRFFSMAFSLRDARDKDLFSVRERLWNLDQKTELFRDDSLYATLHRTVISDPRKILGDARYTYVVQRVVGDALEVSGTFTHRWQIKRGGAAIVDVETEGHESEITVLDSTSDLSYLFAIIAAVVRLNPPSRYANTTD